MTSDAAISMPEDNEDHWPTFTLGPTDYEKAVADIAKTMGHDVTDWRVEHLDPVEGPDGTYIIDVTVRFQIAGMDFLILFECKRHASAVKREHVQVLHAKMQSTGAQKGVLVAASGFQSGALRYARAHGIACVRLVDDAWTYMSRTAVSTNLTAPQPTGTYTGYAITEFAEDYAFTVLTGCPDNIHEVLLDIPKR
ncbi:MAG: restriction endonuclease [Actinomycetales bacterium]|nr:restriction endonuclease [Actinomycetales bacterium]